VSIFGNLVSTIKSNSSSNNNNNNRKIYIGLKVSEEPGLTISIKNKFINHFIIECYYQDYRKIRNKLEDIYFAGEDCTAPLEEDCKKIYGGEKFPKMSKEPIVVLDHKIPMKVKDLFNVFLQLCLWEGFQDSGFARSLSLP
jgi:hypothetical protein